MHFVYIYIQNSSFPFCSAELLGKDHLKPLSLCLYKFLNSSGEATNQSAIQSICQVTDDVIGCLATENSNQLPMYVSLVKRIAGHLEHLKELACDKGKKNHAMKMSRVMRKPAFCICENKDADQLRGNRKADQHLCFRYMDTTIPLLPKSEISSL